MIYKLTAPHPFSQYLSVDTNKIVGVPTSNMIILGVTAQKVWEPLLEFYLEVSKKSLGPSVLIIFRLLMFWLQDENICLQIVIHQWWCNLYVCYSIVVLKLFHVEDPQIDTNTRPRTPIWKHVRYPNKRGDFYSSAVIFNHFNFRDPQFDMHYRLWGDHSL